MKISAVLAKAKNGEIGLNGSLPWNAPEDLKHFRNITKGHTVLMGKNTYNSIGRPLPNRTNIVVSRSVDKIEGCVVVKSIEEGIKIAEEQGEQELFIIGGAKIYTEASSKGLLDRIYFTHIEL